MASRATGPRGHFKFSAQTFAVIVQELCGTVWIDETEPGEMYSKPPPRPPRLLLLLPPPPFLLGSTSPPMRGYGSHLRCTF